MTKPQAGPKVTCHDAQDLHKNIAANMVKTEQAAWADGKVDANRIATKMRTLAADQAATAARIMA